MALVGLLVPLKYDIQKIISDIWVLLGLVLHEQVLERIESFPKTFYYLVRKERVLRSVVLVVQRVQNHEVYLWRRVLEEVAVVRYVNAKERHVEVVRVVVKEAHQQPSWGQGGAHFQVPFVHVGHQEQHSRVRWQSA